MCKRWGRGGIKGRFKRRGGEIDGWLKYVFIALVVYDQHRADVRDMSMLSAENTHFAFIRTATRVTAMLECGRHAHLSQTSGRLRQADSMTTISRGEANETPKGKKVA